MREKLRPMPREGSIFCLNMRSFFRIILFAVQGMWRNFWLSFVTTSVFFLTLLTINAVLVLNVLANASVKSVEEKVQVTVYFGADVAPDTVHGVRSYLLGLSQVKEVTYQSAEDALQEFTEHYQSDPVILAALDETDGNPLGQALKIRAYNAADFPFIVQALDTPEYAPYIKDKNYTDYSSALQLLSNFSHKVRMGFLALATFFGLIAVLIVFNTIRIAIYVHRDEIGIMKLVGANDWFVRGPFLLESLFYALIATGIMMGVTFAAVYTSHAYVQAFFTGVNVDLAGYYTHGAFTIFGLQFAGLAVLGLGTTAFAMRRYLRV